MLHAPARRRYAAIRRGGVGVAVDEGNLVAATVALAGCDQFAAAVGLADVQDFDFFADDRPDRNPERLSPVLAEAAMAGR